MATRAKIAAAAAAHAKTLEPVIQKLTTEGITGTTRIARALNNGGYLAIKGGLWTSAQVEVLLQRLEDNGLMSVPERASNSSALRARADAHARALAPLIAEIREGGAGTFEAIAWQLNDRDIQTSSGKSWTGSTVRHLVLRLGKLRWP